MTDLYTYVALALHAGVVHLCVDSYATKKRPVLSMCREVNLTAPRGKVEVDDLSILGTFNVCRGCVARYELLGYKRMYAPEQHPTKGLPAQIALF